MYSLIIPVYKNSKFIPELLEVINTLNNNLSNKLETIFVVDSNPENEFEILNEELENYKFKSQLILHSRNFGSFAAIKTGLENSTGQYFAVMAADLQEPPELIEKIFNKFSSTKDCNVIVGNRIGRQDTKLSSLFSTIYWNIYKKYVQNDIPKGGVDIFGCDKIVRDILINLKENNSSLIGLLYWIGFKREYIDYKRSKRKYGKSAWSMKKKIKYMSDSIYAFSDIPITLLTKFGLIGVIVFVILSIIAITSKISGNITVPGYTATLLIVTFFSSLNLLSIGILGQYIWRTFENTKNRPNTIVMDKKIYN